MAHQSQKDLSRSTFLVLTVVSVVLLQGLLVADGAFGAMLVAIWNGEFANGQKLHKVYTGVGLIDYTLAMSVSFWTPLARELQATRLEAAMLCASLQALAAWATIEKVRNGNRGAFWRWLPVYMFCWQYFGTAILLPFYFFQDLVQQFGSKTIPDPRVPYLKATSLMPALVIACLLPYRMVFFTPVTMGEEAYQTHVALYQLGPFVCYALIAAFAEYQRTDDDPARTAHFEPNLDAWWIKATYAFFGIFSLVVHIGIVMYALLGSDPTVTLSRLFLPEFDRIWKPEAVQIRYAEEGIYFLQWDLILVVMAAATYITRILGNMYTSGYISWSPLKTGPILVGAALASLILSPGATVSAVLYLREDHLRARYDEQQRRRSDLNGSMTLGKKA